MLLSKSIKNIFLYYHRYFIHFIFPPYTSRRYHFDKFMIKFFDRYIQRIDSQSTFSVSTLNKNYKKWLRKNSLTKKKIEKIKNEIKFFKIKPPHQVHEDVTLWVVVDKKRNVAIGMFYLDLYPRDGKYTHFANFTVTSGLKLPSGEPLAVAFVDMTAQDSVLSFECKTSNSTRADRTCRRLVHSSKIL